MNIQQIDTAFRTLVFTYGIHTQLGITSTRIRNYRKYLKGGQRISLDLKIRLLQRAGIPVMTEAGYPREDLQKLVEFLNKEKVKLEPAYAVDKFLTVRRHAGTPAEHVGDDLVAKVQAIISKPAQGLLF